MLKVVSCSSISFMPIKGGKEFNKYTMAVFLYKRVGRLGIQYWCQNVYAKSQKTLKKFEESLIPQSLMPTKATGITFDAPVRCSKYY